MLLLPLEGLGFLVLLHVLVCLYGLELVQGLEELEFLLCFELIALVVLDLWVALVEQVSALGLLPTLLEVLLQLDHWHLTHLELVVVELVLEEVELSLLILLFVFLVEVLVLPLDLHSLLWFVLVVVQELAVVLLVQPELV